MSVLRITIGAYTPNNIDTFGADLRTFLDSHGAVSEVEGRGINIIPVRHKTEPGSNIMRIAAGIRDRPGMSNRKIYNMFVDLNKSQIDHVLIKLRKSGEIEAESRVYRGHTIYSYFITDKGLEAYDHRVEDFTRGLKPAIAIYRELAAQGMTHGLEVDPRAIRQAMGKAIESTEFWLGWRRLIDSLKIDVAYNLNGPGKHSYFIA